MSCDIIGGRTEQCKSAVSGLHGIYLVNYDDLDFDGLAQYGTGDNTDQIVSILSDGLAFSIYKFELKGTNSFEQSINSSRENGTTFFEQTLSVQLKRQDVKSTKNVKLMSYGRPRIIVHARGDQYFLMGLDQGCDVTSGNISSGSDLGDFNGYSLTFVAREELPANWINATTEAELKTLLQNGAGGTGICTIVTS
tara:strand:+ start:27902 stop:28486 length:585 start_codon:yes stop_codon:yes gene_type:complete